LPDIWEEFLFILVEETQGEAVNGKLNGSRGEDEGAPGVLAYWEGLILGPGEGVEVGGVRGGWGGFVGDGQGDGASRIDSSGEAKGEEAV